MKELFEYLSQFPVDHHGTSWVQASQVVKETGISMEELWKIIQEMKNEAFLDHVTKCIPSAEGLLSVTITDIRTVQDFRKTYPLKTLHLKLKLYLYWKVIS